MYVCVLNPLNVFCSICMLTNCLYDCHNHCDAWVLFVFFLYIWVYKTVKPEIYLPRERYWSCYILVTLNHNQFPQDIFHINIQKYYFQHSNRKNIFHIISLYSIKMLAVWLKSATFPVDTVDPVLSKFSIIQPQIHSPNYSQTCCFRLSVSVVVVCKF